MKTRKPRAKGAPSGSAKGGNTKRATKVGASAQPQKQPSGASGPNSSGAPLSPKDWAAVALWVSRLQALAERAYRGPERRDGCICQAAGYPCTTCIVWFATEVSEAAAPLVAR